MIEVLRASESIQALGLEIEVAKALEDLVNVGFFRGAEIADPEGLLEGTVPVLLTLCRQKRDRE
ncbi:MAG: hypothetical protein A2W29_05275 [Gemmatimonadetes bacterium RBG_16_66_8]|nr:MAG: hypothetical protein A2W29_05275 [Gemmatimonadetes bacterium RBG_16_66_8]